MRLLVIGIILATAAIIAGNYVPEEAESGAEVSAELIDGSEFSWSSTSSRRPLLLKFWATWCAACLKEMPAYNDLYQQYHEEVRFLAVNVAVSDPLYRVKRTVDDFNMAMPVAYDETGTLWNRFGIVGTPTYVLVDHRGQTIHVSYKHDEQLESIVARAAKAGFLHAGPRANRLTPATALKSNAAITDIDGNTVSLTPRPGEVLVAYHFAVWCSSYVKESYPELSSKCQAFNNGIESLQGMDLPSAQLVGFATAYSTDEETVKRFRDQNGIEYPIIFDEEGLFGRRYGVRSFPYLAVIGPSGDTCYMADYIPADIGRRIEDASTDTCW